MATLEQLNQFYPEGLPQSEQLSQTPPSMLKRLLLSVYDAVNNTPQSNGSVMGGAPISADEAIPTIFQRPADSTVGKAFQYGLPALLGMAAGGKKVFSAAEKSDIATRLMQGIMNMGKSMGGTNQYLGDELQGKGFEHISELFEKGIEGDFPTPKHVDNYIFESIRNAMKTHAGKLGKEIAHESGDVVDIGGNIVKAGEEGGVVEKVMPKMIESLPESAQQTSPLKQKIIETMDALQTLPKDLQSLAKPIMTQKLGRDELRSIGKKFDNNKMSEALDKLKDFQAISPADELKAIASPEEIADAIKQVTKPRTPPVNATPEQLIAFKQSKSGFRRLEVMSHPATRYLLEDISPGKLAKDLGYKPSEFKDFNQRLQAVTRRVFEELKKRKLGE